MTIVVDKEAETVKALKKAGVVDAVEVAIMPILPGAGIPLFLPRPRR